MSILWFKYALFNRVLKFEVKKKNIIIAPCGNKSFLFKDSWLKQPEKKEFELCLLFYHEHIDNPSLYHQADYFYHLKGFKYHMLYKLFTEIHPEWLVEYEYFYFLDDDIEIETLQINSLFSLSKAFKGQISQASLTSDSFCSWPIFKQKRNSFCRFVGQIEVMAPLFSNDALKLCLPSFIANRSSWGIDSTWSKTLNYSKDRLIVFDMVTMKHTLPVGGGELYTKIGVDPHKEWLDVTKLFNARKHNYKEYGRLQLVNKKNNRIQFFFYKCNEYIYKMSRALHDYDIPSRVLNTKRKLLNKLK